MAILSSYLSANTIPLKVIANPEIVGTVRQRAIRPWHVQINPTNRCPLNCKYCSCANRDKSQEMPLDEVCQMLAGYKQMGMKAVTVTGGGEPLAHPKMNDIIAYCRRVLEVDIGLTTNAMLVDRLEERCIPMLTWCRVSLTDDNIDRVLGSLGRVVRGQKGWAFSYVMTDDTDPVDVVRAISMANTFDMTHVRLLGDILQDGETEKMSQVSSECKRLGVSEARVIYQDRKHYTRGTSRCLLSLLKPNIGPDGCIYPCCGVQFAQDPPALTFPEGMRMGTWRESAAIWGTQDYFNGTMCAKCYYSEYNDVLNMLWDAGTITHKDHL